jgi:site-specific recombinase XerD
MTSPNERKFKRNYKKHLQHLKGLQPKTIEAYARAIRRIGDYFKHDIDVLRRFWSVHRNPVPLFPNHHAGLDLLEVKKILGHRSILTAAKYTHLPCRQERQ